jgi:phosphatidylserine decarboxylase
MTSLEKPEIVTTNVRWRWPSVHPEGRKFVVISGVIALAFLLFIWDELGFALLGVTIWVAAFFRDPIRTTPKSEDLIVAPADGLVTMITSVPPPRELQGEGGLGSEPVTRVSIFMSVFDVHINRTPIAGQISRVVYIAGKFLNAISTRQARTMSASTSWSRAETACASASRRLRAWWRVGSYPG